ncbi:MAG: hypothetical protein HQL27_00090 [Candidatus Omnitrophica bacterium]|nr:hypothetical protein [Candidatus Omnitrophota bacterium]
MEKLQIDPGAVAKKKKTRTIGALKKTCSSLKNNFSQGTDRLADAWIESSEAKKDRPKKLKEETVLMVKSIANDTKKYFEGITITTVLCDVSYEIGRLSRKTLNAGQGLISQFKG